MLILEPCLFSKRRLLSREYGIQNCYSLYIFKKNPYFYRICERHHPWNYPPHISSPWDSWMKALTPTLKESGEKIGKNPENVLKVVYDPKTDPDSKMDKFFEG